jgi:hypothetical protein
VSAGDPISAPSRTLRHADRPRAFYGGSAVEIVNAILTHDPPEVEDKGLQLIVRRCLERNPEERFQSAVVQGWK